MLTLKKRIGILVMLCVASGGFGCGEPDRETYRDDAAEDFCAEAERCENLGEGIIPDTRSDCVVEMRSQFNSLWPREECDEGRISAEDYDRCMSRALDFACEGDALTGLDALDRCSADNVCTE